MTDEMKGGERMPHLVTSDRFDELFAVKLGKEFARAKKVFENFGEALSWDVANMLMHAADQGKAGEVLTEMEKHYEEYLKGQHPGLRGIALDSMGVNRMKEMFMGIIKDILRLPPPG